MTTWDREIFSAEGNADFLDELSQLEPEEVLEAVSDAVLLAADGDSASEEERLNGQAAATIAAIWSGAPFSAGEISEQLSESASAILEEAAEDDDSASDIDQFLEALS